MRPRVKAPKPSPARMRQTFVRVSDFLAATGKPRSSASNYKGVYQKGVLVRVIHQGRGQGRVGTTRDRSGGKGARYGTLKALMGSGKSRDKGARKEKKKKKQGK